MAISWSNYYQGESIATDMSNSVRYALETGLVREQELEWVGMVIADRRGRLVQIIPMEWVQVCPVFGCNQPWLLRVKLGTAQLAGTGEIVNLPKN